AFNYNGNRINIIPFAANGLKSLSLPSGYDSTTSRLFAGQVVRPRKQAGCCAVVSTGEGQALQAIRRKRDDVNAVAVIVEGHLVDQRWVDGVCRVDHAAIGGISKRVSNCRKVIPAPLGGSVALRDLFRNEVTEHREPAGEVVIDAHNLFLQIRRNT